MGINSRSCKSRENLSSRQCDQGRLQDGHQRKIHRVSPEKMCTHKSVSFSAITKDRKLSDLAFEFNTERLIKFSLLLTTFYFFPYALKCNLINRLSDID